MKNKDNAIEEWAKLVENCKKQEMSKVSANHFLTVHFNEKEIDKDATLVNQLEEGKMGGGSAFWLRVKHIHNYSVSPSLVLFLTSDVITNFGISTMMASYLQYICHKRGIKHIGVKEWSMYAFPNGLPTEEEWQKLWNAQKLPLDMRVDGMIDNMLDYPKVFGKSIIEIKTK